MSDIMANAADFGARKLRLATLIRLRWLAIVGQGAAIAVVDQVFGFVFPAALCLLLVGLSALLNLTLRLRFPASLRLGQWPAFALLAFDVLQLGGLLFLTGGLDNPFAILLLVPVIVSATTLPPRPTVLLGLLVVASASLLAVMHWPLPWRPGESVNMELTYTAGVWVALVSACVFTGVYAFRVAEEARQLAQALNAAEMVLAREQHLSALDGLAAAAAHELATPLATIALVAKELEREIPPGSPARRRRGAAAQPVAALPRHPGAADVAVHPGRSAPRPPAAVAPHRGGGRTLSRLRGEDRRGAAQRRRPEPVGLRNPAIVQGLANLVENAVDFARSGSHRRLGLDRRRGRHRHQ